MRSRSIVAPEIFTLAPDINKNKVVDMYEKEYGLSRSVGEIPEELVEKARRAAEICPVKAIKIEPLM